MTRSKGLAQSGLARRVLRRPEMRRRGLVMADQAASSLSNILVFILVARSFDSIEPVGAFGVAMIASQVVMGGTRAVVGEPLLSLYSDRSTAVRRRLVADLHGAAISVGVASSLVLLGVAAALGGISGTALSALALVLPLILIQDTWRFLFIIDRPAAALAIDMVWLVSVAVILPLAPADASVAWFIVVWGLAGGLGGAVGVILAKGFGGRPHPWRWLVDQRAVGVRFLGEFGAARAVNQLVMSAVGAIAGLGALGAVRASDVYYGPHNVLHGGMYMAVVPEGVQTRHEPHRLRRKLITVSIGLSTVAAMWMIVGLTIPGAWGRAFLGVTWEGARELMIPMGLATMANGFCSGGFMGLRSLADARRSLHARLLVTPWQAAFPLIGVVIGGALGFAVGYAIARGVAAVIWWSTFRVALNDTARLRSPVEELDTPATAPVPTHQEVTS